MKKAKLSILLAVALLILCGTYASAKNLGYRLINTDELKSDIDASIAMIVVDARSPEEFQEVHIKGAINVPVKEWDNYVSRLPSDKGARIVFYCNGVKCGKSTKAAKKAVKMGYNNVLVYAEGIPVWEEKGMPIYAGPDYEKRIETAKITPQELFSLIKSNANNVTVVDVRDLEEYKEGHIPGAINIPVISFASQSGKLDKNKKIIVYCNSGGRSYNAFRKLMKLGYKKIYQAIFYDWKELKLPVVKGVSQN